MKATNDRVSCAHQWSTIIDREVLETFSSLYFLEDSLIVDMIIICNDDIMLIRTLKSMERGRKEEEERAEKGEFLNLIFSEEGSCQFQGTTSKCLQKRRPCRPLVSRPRMGTGFMRLVGCH